MVTANMLLKNSHLLWSQFQFHTYKTYNAYLAKLFVLSPAFLYKQVLLYVVKFVKKNVYISLKPNHT